MPVIGAALDAERARAASVSTEFHRPCDRAWLECLSDVRADVYYLPGYVGLAAHEEGGEALLFVAREGLNLWLLPLIVRPVPADLNATGLCDAVSPYGYSGPLVRVADGVDPAGWNERAAIALRLALVQRGIVSLFVRLHPLRPLPLDSLADVGSIFHHGDTVVIDLTLSPEESWQQTRSRCRSHIRAAERNGFVASMDEHLSKLDRFRSIYEETMRRVGAADSYFFSTEYYAGLQRALSGKLHLCVVERDGEIACAGLFTEMNGTVQYHLSGRSTVYQSSHASMLMIHFVRQWAKQRGNSELHLGGGRGGTSDSLLHFKRGFSKRSIPFLSWRLIVDREAYANLVARWSADTGCVSASDAGDYFPAYRRPRR